MGRTKITRESVETIKTLSEKNVPKKVIATAIGTSTSTVGRVIAAKYDFDEYRKEMREYRNEWAKSKKFQKVEPEPKKLEKANVPVTPVEELMLEELKCLRVVMSNVHARLDEIKGILENNPRKPWWNR